MEMTKPKVAEYAEGRIAGREGAIPAFVKLAYIAIAAGAPIYFLVYLYGAVDRPDRGSLVRAMTAATQASAGLMYAIAALIVVFGVIVVASSFGKPHD